ncbi:hypothetical protein PVAND_005455 [Polypedilum vanderplanki]|uniref:Uncharacterized protein n=1 Tax=Polypedilum vanderplanki TaxID=319348 RepID=A0A9J6C0X4_POLVA|nr:hypothetical protein PVAND_005455 [Polypedilum vanderplanki]
MIWIKIVAILIFINYTICCKNWMLKANVTNCKKDGNIVKILNASLWLNEKCDLVASGCLEYKPFNTAKLKANAKKNDKIIFTLSSNLCTNKKSKNELENMAVELLGFKGNCQVNTPQILCRDETVILAYSQSIATMFSLFNSKNDKTNIVATISHNTGKTCVIEEHLIYSTL